MKPIQIVLLDTRYHRDPIGSDGTILGNSQWLWLERELKGPPTAITIIGSSIQVWGYFWGFTYENLANLNRIQFSA